MVPTRSEANAHAGGQIDEPVRFPCPHRAPAAETGAGIRVPVLDGLRYRHPHGAFSHFTT